MEIKGPALELSFIVHHKIYSTSGDMTVDKNVSQNGVENAPVQRDPVNHEQPAYINAFEPWKSKGQYLCITKDIQL